MAAVQVDRAQSDAMNLQVLKRQDSDVMEIVDTASHVVMYEFDQDNQSWVRFVWVIASLLRCMCGIAIGAVAMVTQYMNGYVLTMSGVLCACVSCVQQKRKEVEGCLFVVKRYEWVDALQRRGIDE